VVVKSDAKGKEPLVIRGFHSQRRERGLGGGPTRLRQRPMSRWSGGSSGERLGMRVPYLGVADRWGHGRLKLTHTTVACGPGPIRFKPTIFFYSDLLKFVKYKT
jgi:hypothetical protein